MEMLWQRDAKAIGPGDEANLSCPVPDTDPVSITDHYPCLRQQLTA